MTVPEDNDGARDRRRGQRARVIWRGAFVAVDESGPMVWHRAYLIDLSREGAAIEVHGPELLLGQRILLRLEAHPSYSDDWLQLRGTIVNRRADGGGNVYGLVFGGLVTAQYDHLLRIVIAAHRRPVHRRL